MSYLQYVGESVWELFHGTRAPSDKGFSDIVLKITPNRVQQYVFANSNKTFSHV